jgi:hypothetical protein
LHKLAPIYAAAKLGTLMNRRQFLKATALLAGCSRLHAAESRSKALYRILYSNDATNVLSCTSPWHAKGAPFRPSMLEASIDEVAGTGVDAHFLQPGLGWVPLWPSKVYPVEEHYRWLKETYGLGPDSLGRFVLNGGDLVKIFVDRCRLRGQAPFISFRLNDVHHKDQAFLKPGEKIASAAAMSLTRFYIEHPEYRIGADTKAAAQIVQNWAIPEVRAHKFAFLRELAGNYDLDGLELDFLRFYSLFPLDRTTSEQRGGIMTDFIREVRALLDRTAREGRRRWLCVRVPCWLKGHDPLGIDLPAMVRAGVDMVNVSASYFTQQRSDFAAIRKSVPGAAVYDELCHTTWTGPKLGPGGDTSAFRRTTAEQYQTSAHLAYAGGGDGVSLFNFAYYREHGGAGRGPFGEPPFEVIKHLADREWLANQPQHYFLAPGWNNPFTRPAYLPRKLQPGKQTAFAFDLAPPSGGWKKDARLWVQTSEPLIGRRFEVRFNDAALVASDDVAEPFPNPYRPMLGTPETLAAWTVPATLLRAGKNRVEVALTAGDALEVAYLDLAIA